MSSSKPDQGKIQIFRGEDDKLHIRGLVPGQKLFKMPDGRICVFDMTPKSSNITVSSSTASKDMELKSRTFTVQIATPQPRPEPETILPELPNESQEHSSNSSETLPNVYLPGQNFCTTLNSTCVTEETGTALLYFVVKIISGQIELSTVVVPSNWLVRDEDGSIFLKYPVHLEADVEKLIMLMKTRAEVQADWPKFGYYIEYEAPTFAEAVAFCVGNMRQAKAAKTSESDSSIENKIVPAVSTALKTLMDQQQIVIDRKLDDLALKVDELRNIIMDRKTAQERDKIMTIDQLLQKHDVKRVLGSEETGLTSKPVFTNFEQFQMFENHEKLMLNADFVVDLQKYFFTTIDSNNSFAQEIEKIFQIFFSKDVFSKLASGTEEFDRLFEGTKFAGCLMECLLIIYKGVKNKIILPQGVFQTTISKTLISATFKKNYTPCMDREIGQPVKRMRS